MTNCAGVVVILPVKPPSAGKSRLHVTGSDRSQLARAFALDTAAAALATPDVLAVLALCDDYRFAHELRSLGCAVVPDGVGDDLNATLCQGAAEAARRWPGTSPIALLADLPALRPDDLAAALRAAADHGRDGLAAFVADAEGTGTVLYAAPLGQFDPRFGRGSAQRHRDAGAHPIGGSLTSLRHDVDDATALRLAQRLGLGPRTAALLDL